MPSLNDLKAPFVSRWLAQRGLVVVAGIAAGGGVLRSVTRVVFHSQSGAWRNPVGAKVQEIPGNERAALIGA